VQRCAVESAYDEWTVAQGRCARAVAQNAEGDRFAEAQTRQAVRAKVDSGRAAPKRVIRSELVQLSVQGQAGLGLRDQPVPSSFGATTCGKRVSPLMNALKIVMFAPLTIAWAAGYEGCCGQPYG